MSTETEPKQCRWWRGHRWDYEPRKQMLTTATQIRRCAKCGKGERLGYFYGELWSKDEIK